MDNTFVISIESRKGGVGKTTAALNLAAYLLSKNFKHILILDLDFYGTNIADLEDSLYWGKYLNPLKKNKKNINLLDLFFEYYLKGNIFPKFNDLEYIIDNKKINIIGSALESNNKLVYCPSKLENNLHKYFFHEFLVEFVEEYSNYCDKNEIGGIKNNIVILDNSPGYAGLVEVLHDKIIRFDKKLNLKNTKILSIISNDKQDIRSSFKSCINVWSILNERCKVVSYLINSEQIGINREQEKFFMDICSKSDEMNVHSEIKLYDTHSTEPEKFYGLIFNCINDLNVLLKKIPTIPESVCANLINKNKENVVAKCDFISKQFQDADDCNQHNTLINNDASPKDFNLFSIVSIEKESLQTAIESHEKLITRISLPRDKYFEAFINLSKTLKEILMLFCPNNTKDQNDKNTIDYFFSKLRGEFIKEYVPSIDIEPYFIHSFDEQVISVHKTSHTDLVLICLNSKILLFNLKYKKIVIEMILQDENTLKAGLFFLEKNLLFTTYRNNRNLGIWSITDDDIFEHSNLDINNFVGQKESFDLVSVAINDEENLLSIVISSGFLLLIDITKINEPRIKDKFLITSDPSCITNFDKINKRVIVCTDSGIINCFSYHDESEKPKYLDCGIKNVATWTINPLNGNLVGGTRDGKVFVWDYKNNNSIINIIRANTTSVKSIHITPNGIMYIIYSSSIYAINTLKNYEIVKRMIIPNKNPFFSIGCFFSDDKVIASSNEGLCFWDLKKQKNIIAYHKQVKEYSLNTFFINILSNNIVYSYDKQIYILEELENKKNRLLYSHANPILSLVAFEDNVFSISIEGDLIVWDFLKETNETFHFNLEEVEYVFLTKERELFLFKKYFKKIEKYSFANGVSNPTMFVETIPYQISSISCSAYSSNHRKAALGIVREHITNEHSENISGTEDYSNFMVIELDLETCIINEIIEMYDSRVQSLAYSPDGISLAVGLMDGTLKVLNLVDRKNSVYFETFVPRVQSLAYSPDGISLAVGLMDGTLHVIEIGSVIFNVRVRKLDESIQSLAYSPDGKTLAVGIKSGALLVFSAESHNVLIEMKPGTIELNGIEIYNVHRISNDKLLIVALLSSLISDEPFINSVDSNIHRNDLDNYICFIIQLCEAYNDSNNLPDYNIFESMIKRKYSVIFSNSDSDLLGSLYININRSIQTLNDSHRMIDLIKNILTKSKEIDYKEKDEMLKEHYLPIVDKVLIGSLPFDEANKEIDSIFENKFYFAQFGACFDRILKDWGIIGE